jgi:hypothetical protein
MKHRWSPQAPRSNKTPTVRSAMLTAVSSQPDYLPRAILEWANRYSWLLDEVASRWLSDMEPPKRSDLQQELMARGSDVYIADILSEMPTPLGWIESSDQRIVLTLFGLRVTPCMSERLAGLGELVALAVERYRTNDPGRFISVGDVERVFDVHCPSALALSNRLFTELPFLWPVYEGSPACDGKARQVS